MRVDLYLWVIGWLLVDLCCPGFAVGWIADSVLLFGFIALCVWIGVFSGFCRVCLPTFLDLVLRHLLLWISDWFVF